MECCIVRKVPYRLPGTKRLVWAVILAEREVAERDCAKEDCFWLPILFLIIACSGSARCRKLDCHCGT